MPVMPTPSFVHLDEQKFSRKCCVDPNYAHWEVTIYSVEMSPGYFSELICIKYQSLKIYLIYIPI